MNSRIRTPLYMFLPARYARSGNAEDDASQKNEFILAYGS